MFKKTVLSFLVFIFLFVGVFSFTNQVQANTMSIRDFILLLINIKAIPADRLPLANVLLAIFSTDTISSTTTATSTPKHRHHSGTQTYSLNYDGNGNTGGTVPTDPNSPYENREIVTVLDNTGSLTKTGYTFTGWNTTADGSGTSYATSSTFTKGVGSMTLYAVWTINSYSITFDSDGGSSVTTITQNYATAITPPSNPTKTGYTFSAWSPTIATTMPVGGQELTAQWTANENTITFNSNYGTVSTTTQIVPTASTTVLTANGFTRDGYTFSGWATTTDGVVGYVDEASYTMGTGDVTLYAVWTINSYTVTFNKNGGDVDANPTTKSANHGGNVGTLPTAPTRTSYNFTSWNTLANGSGTTFDATTVVNANITVYAVWTIADACSHEVTDPDCWSTNLGFMIWGPNAVTNAQSVTDGSANTATLAGLAGSYPAADACAALEEGGFTDWYLPAKNQLAAALTNQFVTPGGTVTGFTNAEHYWSSTEYSDNPGNYAWYSYSLNGSVSSFGLPKDYVGDSKVRCLR